MLLPIAGAVLLRSRCGIKRSHRIGSLLIAFAYLQAGMLVAVLSVLNFALAAFLALLTYSALRIASGRPSSSPLTEAVPAHSWVNFIRGLAVMVFSPVFWAALLLQFLRLRGGSHVAWKRE